MTVPRDRHLTRDTWIIHVTVVVSYFAKATTKAVFGFLLASPPLINDAIHGFIDIGEHGLIAVVGRQARKEAEACFPLGRKPLLDIVGFVIGLSMAGLGLKCLKDGVAAAVHAADILFGLKDLLPKWVVGLLPELTNYGSPSSIWIVGVVFTSCAVVSLAVYRLEYGLARKHRLKEYQDDATELSQDAVLELATGLCVLGAWCLVLTARYFSDSALSFDTVNAVTTAVVLLGLCGYLLKHAKHAIVENVHNLLHPGLDDGTVALLKSHLGRSLPAGCELLNARASDLTAYTAGDVLYVAGTIRIPRAQLAVGDAILDHAQHVAAAFLRGNACDVHVRFFPVPEEWKEIDAIAEWRRLLAEIWSVKADGVAWECFSALKRGDLSKACALAESALEQTDHNERLLRLWVSAMAHLYRGGGPSPSMQVLAKKIADVLEGLRDQDPRKLAFCCWQMLFAITSGKIHGWVDGEVAAVRQALEDASERGTEVPEVLKAEAQFMLGLLAERQDGYDLDQSDRRYRQALALYLRSGFPLEADRLLNTWGHQKSLLFEIEEAGYLLNRSRAIKTLKGDRVGLAFTLGCLGDNHRRAGEFEEAIACYQEDLRTAESLGVDHSAASVTCKLAESEICAGFVGEDKSLLDQGIERLRNLFVQDGLPNQIRFFAGKGLAKGLLWKASAEADSSRAKLLSNCEGVLDSLHPFSSYSAAHLDRLKGRLARLRGDHATAATLLTRAKDAFSAMTGGVDARVSSLQVICCSIEAALASAPQDGKDDKIQASCGDLRNFMASLQGLLGSARERMEPLLELSTSRCRRGSVNDSKLSQLIAFLEG